MAELVHPRTAVRPSSSPETLSESSTSTAARAGTADDDKIDGTKDTDKVDGAAGNDTISGSQSDDYLAGGEGNDTLFGGSDNDSLDGGSGDDTIVGGSGDDVMKGGTGGDVYVIRDGSGEDVITDYAPTEDSLAFDVFGIRDFSDLKSHMGQSGSDTLIKFDDGSTLTLQNVAPSEIEEKMVRFDAGPVCFHAGTLIETEAGPRPIEAIKTGDLVQTLDHGMQPVWLVTSETMRFSQPGDPAKPILIAAGAIGPDCPTADLVVSPQHRILLRDNTDKSQSLLAAVKMLGRPGVRRMRGRAIARYYNLLFADHQVIQANGCFAESLLLTSFIQARLGLSHDGPPMKPARPILTADPKERPRVTRSSPATRRSSIYRN